MAVIKANEADVRLLAQLMRAEAEGEGDLGMLMVGDVGVNRVRSNCLDFRGIRSILKKEHDFVASPVIAEWEEAVKAGNEQAFPAILEKMAREYNLENIQKVLWK